MRKIIRAPIPVEDVHYDWLVMFAKGQRRTVGETLGELVREKYNRAKAGTNKSFKHRGDGPIRTLETPVIIQGEDTP